MQRDPTAFSDILVGIGVNKVKREEKSRKVACYDKWWKQHIQFLYVLLYLSATVVLKATSELCYMSSLVSLENIISNSFYILEAAFQCFSLFRQNQHRG